MVPGGHIHDSNNLYEVYYDYFHEMTLLLKIY